MTAEVRLVKLCIHELVLTKAEHSHCGVLRDVAQQN